eukprot:jgi/Ulvmu1/4406/UM002_0131.1
MQERKKLQMMNRHSVWNSLCLQLSYQAGKDADELWRSDIDVKGALVWLRATVPTELASQDECAQLIHMQQLFLVHEVTDDRIMLLPVGTHGSVEDGTRLMRRADARRKLQLVQIEDFSRNRYTKLMFIWLVSRLRSSELMWLPRALDSWRDINPIATGADLSAQGQSALTMPGQALRKRPRAAGCSMQHQLLRAQPAMIGSIAGNSGPTDGQRHTTDSDVQKTVRQSTQAKSTRHALGTIGAMQGRDGAAAQMKSLMSSAVLLQRVINPPTKHSTVTQKVPKAAITRRINADKRRMRAKLDAAKVHERKQEQKQSFLSLPQTDTEAMDLPNLRRAPHQ